MAFSKPAVLTLVPGNNERYLPRMDRPLIGTAVSMIRGLFLFRGSGAG